MGGGVGRRASLLHFGSGPGVLGGGLAGERVRVCLRCQQATATVSLSLGGRGLAAAQCRRGREPGCNFDRPDTIHLEIFRREHE